MATNRCELNTVLKARFPAFSEISSIYLFRCSVLLSVRCSDNFYTITCLFPFYSSFVGKVVIIVVVLLCFSTLPDKKLLDIFCAALEIKNLFAL